MTQIKQYHRPTSVDDAMSLLTRTEVTSAALAWGTESLPRLPDDTEEVIDLQAAGLDTIARDGDRLTLGAMVTLQTLVDLPDAPALIREMAQREGPNTVRNALPLGGVILNADWESELLAALLVFEAQVSLQTGDGSRRMPLVDFLPNQPFVLEGGGLITAVSFETEGQTASARVARTPTDRAIVAVVGRVKPDRELLVAACGVETVPVIIDTTADLGARLTPPEDFRGTSVYRREMAVTLSARVVETLSREAEEDA